MQTAPAPPHDVPAAHPMHVLAPELVAYFPESHVLQPVDDPISSWNCPGPQDTQPRLRFSTTIAPLQPT